MKLTLFSFVTILTYVTANRPYPCTRRSALMLLKRPAYDFSMQLLQRVTDNSDAHFVYSPLSTWLQLTALADGAKYTTRREIWAVTKHHRNKCFRRKLREIFKRMDYDMRSEGKRQSVMVLHNMMAIKKQFVMDVEKLYGIKIMLLNFDRSVKSAEKVNRVIKEGTDGVIDTIVYYDDFMSTVVLLGDASYFKSDWLSPFNSANTKLQLFYANNGVVKKVSMMNQVGSFNVVDFPNINTKILELPCANNRTSMLIFLSDPIKWAGDTFYDLRKTRLAGIFNMFKREGPKVVNVTLPRFKIRSDVSNLPELLSDMGIRRIFNPNTAELNGMSDFKMYASLMTQVADIEVTEKGVTASSVPYPLAIEEDSVDFVANRPFTFMIVDKPTEFILYAGIYTVPSEF